MVAITVRAAWLLAVLMLAGCSAPEDSSGTSTTGPTTTATSTSTGPGLEIGIPMLSDFTFENCQGMTFAAPRPVADVQAILPDPFVVVETQGSAELRMQILRCQAFKTPTTQINSTWFGATYVRVEKPNATWAAAGDRQEFAFRILAQNDVLATLWRAGGFATYGANATWDLLPNAIVPVAAQANIGDYTGRIVRGTPIAESQSFVRYSPHLQGGMLVWNGTQDFTGEAVPEPASYFMVEEGDPMASMAESGGFAAAGEWWTNASVQNQYLLWWPR